VELEACQDTEHHADQGDEDERAATLWGEVQDQRVALPLAHAKRKHTEDGDAAKEREAHRDRDHGPPSSYALLAVESTPRSAGAR